MDDMEKNAQSFQSEASEEFSKKTEKKSIKKPVMTAGIILAVLAVLICAVFIIITAMNNSGGKLPTEPSPKEFTDGLAADDASKTNETDLRVLSAELSAAEDEDISPRAKMFVETMQKYTPEVIGLRQVNKQWKACLKNNLPDGYVFVKKTLASASAIAYNEKLLTPKTSGTQTFSAEGASEGSGMSWSVFERIADKKIFAVVSVRFDSLTEENRDAGIKVMQGEKDELIALADKLESENSCPVILIGGFESAEDTEKTTPLDAKEIYLSLAEKYRDSKPEAFKAKSGNGKSLSEPIRDHIFLSGDQVISRYRLLSDIYMNGIGSSYMLYADFAI